MEEELPKKQLKKEKLTWSLLHVTLISGFGSTFQFGYNLWVLFHPALLIQHFYNQTYYERTHLYIDKALLAFLWDLMISMFPIGGMIGCLLSAPLADNYGRKISLLGTSILSVTSAVFMSLSKLAQSYELIFLARFTIGIGVGVSSNVVPMYLSEVAPTNLRGAIVMVSYLFFTFGALIAQLFGLHLILGNYTALKKLRGHDDVEDELKEFCQEDLAETEEKTMDIFSLLCFPALRWQYISVCVLSLGQQLSGIHIIQFHLESIYLSTGIEEFKSQYFSVLVTFAMVLLSFGLIFVVDSWGRKALLLIGFGMCSFSCVFFTMCFDLQKNIPWMSYLSTTFAVFFFFGNTIGPSPIPSVVIGELFLQSSRSTAYEIGGLLKWLNQFISMMVFFHIEDFLWTYTLLFFLPVSAMAFYYIIKKIPETSNKTLLEIRAALAKEDTTLRTA